MSEKETCKCSRRYRLLLGLLAVLGVVLYFFPQGLSPRNWLAEFAEPAPVSKLVDNIPIKKPERWPPPEFKLPSRWCSVKIDKDGWTTGPVGTFEELGKRFDQKKNSDQEKSGDKELLLPVFPSVYMPMVEDKIYYDEILQSDIQPGDKVLVIGTGSGTDSWVASLKSQAPIYVIEINPMAVVNAKATAHLAGFEIKPIVGDIRNVELPDDFGDFDYVLWNMPFLAEGHILENRDFHDGDDGSILRRFLKLLPKLLKKDGTAIILNYDSAKPFYKIPDVRIKEDNRFVLFVFPNPGEAISTDEFYEKAFETDEPDETAEPAEEE